MDANSPNPESAPQSDIDGLIAQSTASASPAASPSSPSEVSASPRPVFKRLSSFTTNESRKLKERHEEFTRTLSARLSGHLRLEVGVKLSRLETIPFEALTSEFANPTHIALLKLEPFKATCLLEIPVQLALSIVDRELGGPGECLDADRALTEIESRILSRTIEIAAGEWCESWRDMLELRCSLSEHESNPAFLQSHAPDTRMLVISIEVQMGELTKPINFAFPYAPIEPMIKKLDLKPAEAEKKPAAKTSAPATRWNPALNDVNIKVTAEIPSLKITAKELTKLKAGDVILLEPEVFQNLRLNLGDSPKFLASAGRCGPRWAAKITKVIPG